MLIDWKSLEEGKLKNEKALKIYSLYIPTSSIYTLNLTDTTRVQIEDLFKSNEKINDDSFEEAEFEVLKMLNDLWHRMRYDLPWTNYEENFKKLREGFLEELMKETKLKF
jgi:hypothetical protein